MAQTFAKKIHVARAVDFRGIELGKDCVFPNDQEGLTKLAAWMKELGRVHQKVMVSLNQVKTRITNWLDRYFPEDLFSLVGMTDPFFYA